jgi:NADH-quinone oxidoreductase subunit G
MSDLVNLIIDDVEVSVPEGTVVVDAAKRIGNDIPVFCYHPKMDPVGMCRMCLVEVGMPVRDRTSGELVKDETGNPKINFGRVLQTGCTVRVAEGMVVKTTTDVVTDARDDIIEFLLTSHPLDCPICDKGGECPLQNLTMRYGPGASRFDFSDKIKLDKHVSLGDLIYLDRERCIQCARCTRFQSEIVDDPVIGFHNRGRRLEIVTLSDPGFDSYWSGNTTDICPVGALTTADFRFGARPWELTPVASLCPHCPVGCNTTMSTRQEAKAGGKTVIKRIMPRQNERVNEIWICDKGRFVHHFADSPARLENPLVREGGKLVETSWEEALDLAAGRLQMTNSALAGVASDRLSNEDLYMFQKLFRQGLSNPNIDLSNNQLGGGEVVASVGLASGSNLRDLESGDAILIVATDLHEEAPVWWLRVKQAVERGVEVTVLNLRTTRIDKFASHRFHYAPGEALDTVHQLLNAAKVVTESPQDPIRSAANSLMEAENLVVFYGGEGLNYEETDILARLLGNLLLIKQENGDNGGYRAGRLNNGLIAVWPHGNTQGAWDMGLRSNLAPGYVSVDEKGLDAASIYKQAASGDLKALYLLGADPIGDKLMDGRGQLEFLVVQDLFLTESANQADVVLPAQSWAEREGTYTSGERRVQRFYPAVPVVGQSRADWQILAKIGERVGLGKPPFAASLLFREISETVPQYVEMSYRSLAQVEKQWPDVGGEDLYFGGTSYNNKSGLGQQWPVSAESSAVERFELPDISSTSSGTLTAVPVAHLYTRGTLLNESSILGQRFATPSVSLNVADADHLTVANDDPVTVQVNGSSVKVIARVNEHTPAGVALISGLGPSIGSGPAEISPADQDKSLA